MSIVNMLPKKKQETYCEFNDIGSLLITARNDVDSDKYLLGDTEFSPNIFPEIAEFFKTTKWHNEGYPEATPGGYQYTGDDNFFVSNINYVNDKLVYFMGSKPGRYSNFVGFHLYSLNNDLTAVLLSQSKLTSAISKTGNQSLSSSAFDNNTSRRTLIFQNIAYANGQYVLTAIRTSDNSNEYSCYIFTTNSISNPSATWKFYKISDTYNLREMTNIKYFEEYNLWAIFSGEYVIYSTDLDSTDPWNIVSFHVSGDEWDYDQTMHTVAEKPSAFTKLGVYNNTIAISHGTHIYYNTINSADISSGWKSIEVSNVIVLGIRNFNGKWFAFGYPSNGTYNYTSPMYIYYTDDLSLPFTNWTSIKLTVGGEDMTWDQFNKWYLLDIVEFKNKFYMLVDYLKTSDNITNTGSRIYVADDLLSGNFTSFKDSSYGYTALCTNDEYLATICYTSYPYKYRLSEVYKTPTLVNDNNVFKTYIKVK